MLEAVPADAIELSVMLSQLGSTSTRSPASSTPLPSPVVPVPACRIDDEKGSGKLGDRELRLRGRVREIPSAARAGRGEGQLGEGSGARGVLEDREAVAQSRRVAEVDLQLASERRRARDQDPVVVEAGGRPVHVDVEHAGSRLRVGVVVGDRDLTGRGARVELAGAGYRDVSVERPVAVEHASLDVEHPGRADDLEIAAVQVKRAGGLRERAAVDLQDAAFDADRARVGEVQVVDGRWSRSSSCG